MGKLPQFVRRPANLVWLAVALTAYAAAASFGLFEHMYELSRAHEDWELDEFFSLFIVASLSIPVFLLRWNRSLAQAHRQTTEAEAEAQHIAFHDPLTGLPNRRFFFQHLEEKAAQARATRGAGRLTVLLLDLDRFKPVNDLRGHEAGDALLCEVGRRLRRLCPKDALVARLGGDEFAVALWKQDAEDHGAGVARRINEGLAEPFDFGEWSATISCSVGLADWSETISAPELLRHADQAMYRAKQAGRAGYAHYDEGLGQAMRERAALEQDLRQALEQGAITPHFQPIYDVRSQELRGAEVLSRWTHPVHGAVPPDVFIVLAEEIGLIDRLSDVVLDQACAALASWGTALRISFNLSPVQFSDPTLPQRILGILDRHGIPGCQLEVEITERAMMADMGVARQIIDDLIAAGVRISLDDFGTGTSSLALLTQLPIDSLKIDRSFIAEVDRSPDLRKIVSGVLLLAKSLEIDVTAEGIERTEELTFLEERHCALAQGYLLGRPQSADSMAQLLNKKDASSAVVVPLFASG